MVLYEADNVKLEYDPELKIITWTPDGFVTGDAWSKPFLIGMDFYIETIKVHPDLGWLNDVRKLKTVKTEEVLWLDANVNDKANSIGGKKVAFVLPGDVFGKLAIRLYAHFTTRKDGNSLEVKAFKTINEAKGWLTGTASKVNEIRLA
jgi:hypothetical protein